MRHAQPSARAEHIRTILKAEVPEPFRVNVRDSSVIVLGKLVQAQVRLQLEVNFNVSENESDTLIFAKIDSALQILVDGCARVAGEARHVKNQ